MRNSFVSILIFLQNKMMTAPIIEISINRTMFLSFNLFKFVPAFIILNPMQLNSGIFIMSYLIYEIETNSKVEFIFIRAELFV